MQVITSILKLYVYCTVSQKKHFEMGDIKNSTQLKEHSSILKSENCLTFTTTRSSESDGKSDVNDRFRLP